MGKNKPRKEDRESWQWGKYSFKQRHQEVCGIQGERTHASTPELSPTEVARYQHGNGYVSGSYGTLANFLHIKTQAMMNIPKEMCVSLALTFFLCKR